MLSATILPRILCLQSVICILSEDIWNVQIFKTSGLTLDNMSRVYFLELFSCLTWEKEEDCFYLLSLEQVTKMIVLPLVISSICSSPICSKRWERLLFKRMLLFRLVCWSLLHLNFLYVEDGREFFSLLQLIFYLFICIFLFFASCVD